MEREFHRSIESFTGILTKLLVMTTSVRTFADPSFNFSFSYVIVQDGLGRMLDFVGTEDFVFKVNEENILSTVCEAILISPLVSESLLSDHTVRLFNLSPDIQPKHFHQFLDFIRFHESMVLSVETALAFLSICRSIGNEHLPLGLLASLHSNSPVNSDSTCDAVSSTTQPETILFRDATIEDCASKFYLYSVSELRAMDKRTLHSLLSSASLRVESEDTLLNAIIALGSDYSEFWSYINVQVLTRDKINQFVASLDFNFLTHDLWVSTGNHLKGAWDVDIAWRRFRPNFASSLFPCCQQCLRSLTAINGNCFIVAPRMVFVLPLSIRNATITNKQSR
jgi:hypothetical protein